jgi:hypothetical protein
VTGREDRARGTPPRARGRTLQVTKTCGRLLQRLVGRRVTPHAILPVTSARIEDGEVARQWFGVVLAAVAPRSDVNEAFSGWSSGANASNADGTSVAP